MHETCKMVIVYVFPIYDALVMYYITIRQNRSYITNVKQKSDCHIKGIGITDVIISENCLQSLVI